MLLVRSAKDEVTEMCVPVVCTVPTLRCSAKPAATSDSAGLAFSETEQQSG